MKVEQPGIKGAAGPYKAGAVREVAPGAAGAGVPAVAGDGAPPAGPVDSLTLSQKAQEAARLRSLLRSAPDVRTALVDRIKAQVAAGQYHVAPLDLADRLLKSRVLE